MSDKKITCTPGYAITFRGALNIAVLVCAALCLILLLSGVGRNISGELALYLYLLCIIGMCFNVIFLACGMLNMEIYACFKYVDIGFSIGLSFCFAIAGIALSLKASARQLYQLNWCAAIAAVFFCY